ncbi:MAG: DUF4301 family protein [Muribaculaceae bacterium]|nr:DUF4301 family protein [Muribaculaceae bacterium]
MKFSDNDLKQLQQRGISPEQVRQMLDRFSTGFPYLTLTASATPGNGITVLDPLQIQQATQRWQKYLEDGGSVMKFVPASGAASRMFKELFAFLDGTASEPQPGSDVDIIISHLDELPFIEKLEQTCQRLYGTGTAELKKQRRYKDIVAAIITPAGMNYGALPKALLTFHSYPDGTTRTSLEEQLAEGAQTAAVNGVVHLHFTVSHDHRPLFKEALEQLLPAMEKRFGVKYDITLSEQLPATDTIAADENNQPFRDADGSMVFRPGGHGALIRNLNDLDSTVVFIKNIDNVVPDTHRASTVQYKQVLGGTLILIHDALDSFIEKLKDSANLTDVELARMVTYLRTVLCTEVPGIETLGRPQLIDLLLKKFDRPLRVCGMVRNQGEPGGGPFITRNPDGSASPQILESGQINLQDPAAAALFRSATHFNPVDLVCYLHHPDGTPYDLTEHTDPDTGFISSKSLHGRKLKALELPGLWNGAMSDWNTVFVEVPADTFNPVKTLNDLLRPAHKS